MGISLVLWEYADTRDIPGSWISHSTGRLLRGLRPDAWTLRAAPALAERVTAVGRGNRRGADARGPRARPIARENRRIIFDSPAR